MRIAIVAALSLLSALVAFEAADAACMNKGHSLKTTTTISGPQITCDGVQCPPPYRKDHAYKCDQDPIEGKRCIWASQTVTEEVTWTCVNSKCKKNSNPTPGNVPSSTGSCP